MSERNIAITGGAGFIGSHLVEELIGLGYRVLAVDSLRTGNRANLHPDAEFLEMDIADDRLEQALVSFKPDAVYHLAAQASVARSVNDPQLDAKINVLGSANVLASARAAGARKMIYASSAAVYGVPRTRLIDESHPVAPTSYYGISKLVPEFYLNVTRGLFGLEYTVLRYANVYGERQSSQGEGGVVSIFADKLASGATPVIYGDGKQTRDFVYVKDIASANVAALHRGDGFVINVGNGTSTSVNELLDLMCATSGIKSKADYLPAKAGDIVDSSLDNTLAKKQLGWTPRYSLKDGIEATMAYYSSIFSARSYEGSLL